MQSFSDVCEISAVGREGAGLWLLTRAAATAQHQQIDVLSHSYLCVQRDVNKSTHADRRRRRRGRKGIESLPSREKGR